MLLTDFSGVPVWINALVFLVAATIVWWSGARLSGYVELIADRTGLGRAFAGALLLGGATSLPEIATTLTAAASGAARLAGHNLLGGVAMQLAVLAAVDAFALRGKALTSFSVQPVLLIQGVMLILLNALAAAAISAGELFTVAGVGAWSVVLAGAFIAATWINFRFEKQSRWEPSGVLAEPPQSAGDLQAALRQQFRDVTTARLAVRFTAFALGVLASGFVVARSGEALAEQTGLGQNLVGATLVALATSLPEISTTWTAVRFGAYAMAIANILGTNLIEVALFFPADVFYRAQPIFDALDPSAGFLAALSIVMTSLYVWGVLERRVRTILGMGIDSAAVLVVYTAGLAVLFFLETGGR